MFKLQPKKANWDLKRDLARKMEVLDVRTDNAIARMVRERIEGQKKAQREAAAVGGGSTGGSTGGGMGGDEEVEGAENVGLKGEELVEGIHQREREEAVEDKTNGDEEDEDEEE